MAITMPDPHAIRLAHDYENKPGVAKVAITAPGPLSISATGTLPSGEAYFEPTVAANRDGYVGFALVAASAGRGITAVRDTVLVGFAGVTPGSLIYVGDDGALTHTAPTGDVEPIGVGFTPDKIMLY
jgi:hypothetical protein